MVRTYKALAVNEKHSLGVAMFVAVETLEAILQRYETMCSDQPAVRHVELAEFFH